MGPFDLTELLGVLAVTKTLPHFWLQFFPDEMTFTTEAIAMDEISEDYRRLAPFVAPNVQGRVAKQDGFRTVSYKPAYVKPKDVVDPNNNMFVRRPGEALTTGTMSPEQRFEATVAQLLRNQRTKIDNRLEWMAAKVIQNGEVTIDGVDYPQVTIDFNRDASLTGVLVGTAQWDDSAANPLGDIKTMNSASNALCGATGHRLIFGADAWDSFSAWMFANEIKMLNNDYRGSDSEITMFSNGYEGLEYMGRVRGSNGAGFDCWVYSSKYTDDDGVQQDMMDQDTVVGVSSMVNGVQAFGAIRDRKAGLAPLRYFPKMWDVDDPSVTYLMTQSAPLMVPRFINATWSLKVQ